jgi:riboflavin biosynthesis pyrimidine reductase
MEAIHTLLDRQPPAARPTLPDALRALYGGDLRFPAEHDRLYVAGNFVTTLDGVVSYSLPGSSGGSQISGSNEGDRFIMGLLRASADAVIVGAGTVQAVSPKHLWVADYIYTKAAEEYASYRRALRKAKYPLNVVASGSGNIDLQRAVFQTPQMDAVILTTAAGKQRIDSAHAVLPSNVCIRIVGEAGVIPPRTILDLLRNEFGVRLLLHEGGPTLFGQFLAQNLIDELFLTLAPQIAGRTQQTKRPAVVEGVAFRPESAPWLKLLTLKQSGDHLYLRYRREAS